MSNARELAELGLEVDVIGGNISFDSGVFVNGAPQSWSGDPLVINSSASRSNLNFLHSGTGQAAATDGLEIALVYNNAEFSLKENGYMAFETNDQERMRITTDKVQFNVDAKVDADNTRDLGASGARWKDLYLSGSMKTGTGQRTVFTQGGFYDDLVNGNNTGVMTGGNQIFLSDGSGNSTDNGRDIGATNRRIRNIYVGSTVHTDRLNVNDATDVSVLNGSAAAGINTGSVYAGVTYSNRSVPTGSGIIESENGFRVDGKIIIDDEGRHAGHQGQPVVGDGGYGSIRYRVARGAYYNNHSYIHIKTTLRVSSNGTHGGVSEMYRVNIHGYSYGNAQAIDAICVGYVYSGGGYVGSQNVTYPSGTRPVTQYMSSDGYLTFTITASTYYCTFALDWERAGGNGTLRDGDSILSVTTSNSATI